MAETAVTVPKAIWERILREYELSTDEAVAVLATREHHQTDHGNQRGCCSELYDTIAMLTGGRLNHERMLYRTAGALAAIRFYEEEGLDNGE